MAIVMAIDSETQMMIPNLEIQTKMGNNSEKHCLMEIYWHSVKVKQRQN